MSALDWLAVIGVGVCLLDIFGVVNIQGWGGKRENIAGEPLP